MQLSEFATIFTGYSFRERVVDDPAGDVLVMQAGDLDGLGGVSWEGVLKVRLPRRGRATWLQPGDILLPSKGARGTVAVVKATPGDAICVSNLFVVRAHADRVLPDYLAAFIGEGPGRAYLEHAAEGARVAHLRKTVLEAMPIAPPSLDEQQRVVALKAAIDEELEVMERLRSNRQQTLASVLGHAVPAQ